MRKYMFAWTLISNSISVKFIYLFGYAGFWLWHVGLIPWLWPPALGAQSLNHWATREVPEVTVFYLP